MKRDHVKLDSVPEGADVVFADPVSREPRVGVVGPVHECYPDSRIVVDGAGRQHNPPLRSMVRVIEGGADG